MVLIRCNCNRLLWQPIKPLNQVGYYSKFLLDKKYKKCYEILQVDEKSDQETIRMAFLKLVKKYHPDSGTKEASAEKFQEIDEAFKVLMDKKSKERWDVEDHVEEQDIQHTAPQHRQYLSHDGIGYGNPFQREKQYGKVRAMKAVENVYNHRISKINTEENSLMEKVPLKHNIKTKYGFERLVEDLIQESMAKGEFTNLKNSGKPLPETNHNYNPYVDFITHKLNEVLIDNGFTPEWITLQKEIHEEANTLRRNLLMERHQFGAYPLSIEDNIEWSEIVYKKYQKLVDKINQKILKFNLVVPVLNKQMVQISLEKEAQNAIINGAVCQDCRIQKISTNQPQSSADTNQELKNSHESSILGFIEFLLKK